MTTESWLVLTNILVVLASLAVTAVTVIAAFVTYKDLDHDTQETVRETLRHPPVPIPHVHKPRKNTTTEESN